MAARSVFDPLSEQEQWRVSAYLIAISPELQKSFSLKKEQDIAAGISRNALETVRAAHDVAMPGPGTIDLAVAKGMFEELCTQCHGLKNLENSPPTSQEEAADLVGRMVENGLECSDDELAAVIFYLTETYTK
jgi:hypothetical protein